jgi:hypothetical protein
MTTRRWWNGSISRRSMTSPEVLEDPITKSIWWWWWKFRKHRQQDLWVVQLESTHGCKYPSLDSGATPIRSAGRAPDKNNKSINNQINSKRNGPDGSNETRIVPGDLISCRITLFCHRQLANIGLSNKTGLVIFIPYVQPSYMTSPEVLEDLIY